MTEQNHETTMKIHDNLVLMGLFVRELATIEQVEAINAWLAPLNDAIVQRLVPHDAKIN